MSAWTAGQLEERLALLRFTLCELDSMREEDAIDTEPWLRALADLRDLKTQVANVCEDIQAYLVPKLDYRTVVAGLGVVEKKRRKDRTQWDKERLLTDVLDSKLVVAETGELVDETPLERVLHVWTLPAPKVTALRTRGLDPEDYCHSEDRGYELRLTPS